MKIVEIPAAQFNELTKNHPLASFEQTANWAKLKKYTGWQSFFIAYEDENYKELYIITCLKFK